MVHGINHITLSVRSLSESFTFYKEVLGFKPLMRKPRSVYFLAGDLWFCIEEDHAVRTSELPEYTHFAFSADQESFKLIRQRILDANVKIFKSNQSEGDSIYFVDPNGHKLEIHVGDWKSRLTAYRGQPDTEFFD